MDNNQFLTDLENHSEPLISFKDLINSISNYTNKTPSQIADRLEKLLFDFRKGGNRNQYDNAFCYCTIFERSSNGKTYTYEPLTNYFKDTFDHIKRYLNSVIAQNSVDVLELSQFAVRRSEITQQIKKTRTSILDRAPKSLEISRSEADYISLYELLEWAKSDYPDLSATAKDLLRLLDGKEIQLYRHYTGIKKSIDKDNQRLDEMLDFVKRKNSYEVDIFEFDIPF